MTDNFDSFENRFRITSGPRTVDRYGGWRELTVISNPWLKHQREKESTMWTDEAEAETNRINLTPYAVRTGEMTFTTSQALVLWPYVIWDVNAYYAELGVDPRATRHELKVAYMEKNGQESERLTYILRQLLDPEIRRLYDGSKFGSMFFDQYLAALVKRRMVEDHRNRFGRSLDIDEQIEEGLTTIDLDARMNQEVPGINGQNLGVDLEESHRPRVESKWKWGFYLWKTNSYDIDKLSAWQNALCVAFKDHALTLSVGLMSGDEDVKVVYMGGHSIAFINVSADPTPPLARTLESKLLGDDESYD